MKEVPRLKVPFPWKFSKFTHTTIFCYLIIIGISMKILATILWVRVHGVVHRSLSKMVCNNGADSTKHYIARNSVTSVMASFVWWVKIN